MKILILCLLISLPAFARIKEVGGGSGDDGTLTDRQVYSQGQLLDGFELLKLVRTRFAKEFATFPELDVLSGRMLIDAHRKRFLVDERPLSPACRNQPTAGVSVEAWACQDFASVRIYGPIWRKLTDGSKGDLIFHEILTAVALLNPNMNATFAYVSAAFAAVTDRSLTPDEIQREWVRIGFGYLPTAGEWTFARANMDSFANEVCAAKTSNQRDMIAFHRAAKLRSGEGTPQTQLWIGQSYLLVNARYLEWGTCSVLRRDLGEYLWNTWYSQMASSPASGDMSTGL